MKDKKLIVKYTVICETDTSMIKGDTYEEKLENWKNKVEDTFNENIDNLPEAYLYINCEEFKIKSYK